MTAAQIYLTHTSTQNPEYASKCRAEKTESARRLSAENPEATEYRREYNRMLRCSPAGRIRETAAKHRRRDRLRGSYTPDELTAKYEEYDNRCAYCGSPEQITVDHVVPVSKGGGNSIDNIVPACMPCNLRKQARDVEEFLEDEWLKARRDQVSDAV